MNKESCQLAYLDSVSEGSLKYPPLSLFRRIKLEIRKKLKPDTFRSLKKCVNVILSKMESDTNEKLSDTYLISTTQFRPGDRVRVRSETEINALIDRWKETKGCGFMDGMWEYCNTIQVVKKPINRFVDERTLQIKKASGIVILENAQCKGTLIFGECDRSCYFFWREEWLEKIS